ncbi:MAG TPA: hypothetical protein VGG08_04440 [Solirubrobacteraceae bacterium]|jgi:hypothetical protein
MAERRPDFEAEGIFAVLEQHGVEYVVVGGVAVQAHGHVRMTNDLDLIPAPTHPNLEHLAAALRQLDARILNPGSERLAIDAKMLPRATLWQLSTALGDIDLLHDAPGAAPYEQLRSRALVIALGDQEIPIVGRDDLISMKRASGRPVDLEDIAALTEPEHRGRSRHDPP